MLKGEGSLGTRLVFYCHTIYCCSISNDAVNPSVQAFKKEDTLDSNLDKELGMHYVFLFPFRHIYIGSCASACPLLSLSLSPIIITVTLSELSLSHTHTLYLIPHHVCSS